MAGDQTKAYEVWDDAIEKFKSNQMTYRVIANYAIERRDFEKAIELLNLGKKITKDPYLYSYDLGRTLQHNNALPRSC